MTKVFMIAGLGFGDEGKGTITEYLTHKEKAHTVIRYNGGSQAAHNVVRPDGTHHTFSQFGSGTFEGAATHLSRFMIVDPTALITEGLSLEGDGISDVFNNLTLEEGALLITPYHKAANRLREFLRSDKHGSCGIGIGEAVSDSIFYPDISVTADDLHYRRSLEEKLSSIRNLKLEEFSRRDLWKNDPKDVMKAAFRLLTMPVTAVADRWMDAASKINLVSDDYFHSVIMEKPGAVVFEGAQGILLDQTWGFHPHTTWSDITFANADKILDSHKPEHIEKIGVIRTYHTRHGAGPFPSALRFDKSIELPEVHNGKNDWQGAFRVGYFDMVLFKYALRAIKNLDHVAVTHMDMLPKLPKMCISYSEHGGDIANHLYNGQLKNVRAPNLEYQQRLGNALQHSGLDLNYWPVNDDFLDVVKDMANVKLNITSYGPTVNDKVCL